MIDIAPKPLRFSDQDLAGFSAASGDNNPLHLSTEYSRSTAYGQRVVFGGLGVFACLAYLPWNDRRVSKLTAEFLRPIFIDVNYEIRFSQAGDTWSAFLYDGSIHILSVVVESDPTRPLFHAEPSEPRFDRNEASIIPDSDFVPGHEIGGVYACDGGALAALRQRWNVSVDSIAAEALLWSSYAVGMRLPGRSALFFKCAMDFPAVAGSAKPFRYKVAVRSFDPRMRQLRASFELRRDEIVVTRGEYRSFSRASPSTEAAGNGLQSDPLSLTGQVIVVAGASRGLGAALVEVLDEAGAAVYGVCRSQATNRRGQFISGDISNPETSEKLRLMIEEKHGRLDALICNACPPILPLRLESNALSRISEYIHLATAMVATPLCVFLPMLNATGGCAVVISSTAVEKPVREWPHYLAAKRAVEALAEVAPLQYQSARSLIVRPEKLLTEMTNTPMGRVGAIPPQAVASRIGHRLCAPPSPGTCEILR